MLISSRSAIHKAPRFQERSAIPALGVPPAAQTDILIDFDGTITRTDVIDALLRTYAIDDSWLEVEEQWQRGEIGSLECLRREFDLIRIDAPTLQQFLDEIPIDPGAERLFSLARENGVPMTILSDGVDWFIRRILGRLNLGTSPLAANTVEQTQDRLGFTAPHHDVTCSVRAAHCKCASAARCGDSGVLRKHIYIGDGRSDLCAASRCEIVFAKGALAAGLTEAGKPFRHWESLHDVADVLSAAWKAVH